MHSKEQLVDLHIREHDSRQKHVDELLQRIERHVDSNPQLEADLTALEGKREKLAEDLAEFKQHPVDKWAVHEIEDAGPMGIWYGLISELESFIERVEK